MEIGNNGQENHQVQHQSNNEVVRGQGEAKPRPQKTYNFDKTSATGHAQIISQTQASWGTPSWMGMRKKRVEKLSFGDEKEKLSFGDEKEEKGEDKLVEKKIWSFLFGGTPKRPDS